MENRKSIKRKMLNFCFRRRSCDGCPFNDWHTCDFRCMDDDELKQAHDIVYDADDIIKPETLVEEHKFKTVRDLIQVLRTLPMDVQVSDGFDNTLGVVIVEDGKIKLEHT